MKKKKEKPYQMGNAGDLIKHGALSLFVCWWFNRHSEKSVLRFADPFGNLPYEAMECETIKTRLETLKEKNAFVAECFWDGGKYRNSGHIVAEAARKCGNEAEVWTSDSCPDIRQKLASSGLRMLNEKYPGYDNGDGYSILQHAGDFNLVLLDPYADLLTRGFGQFDEIRKAVDNPKVVVMVFVLDRQSVERPPQSDGIWEKHKRYFKKRGEFGDIAFSLRCPKIVGENSVCGESKYEMEILLISQMFANGGGADLRESLQKFAIAATEVLPLAGGEKVEVWPK